jgi:hypothetical protein
LKKIAPWGWGRRKKRPGARLTFLNGEHTAAGHDTRARHVRKSPQGKAKIMKKSVVLTSVASLLTFASVAVLPAFAVDTGGMQRTKSFNYQKSEDGSRSRGERERYAKGDQKGYDGYRSAGYDKKDHRGEHERYRWGHGKKEYCGERQHGHRWDRDRGHKGGRSYASR